MRLFWLIIIVLPFITGCNPARRLPENQYLLHRNNISIEDAGIKKDELRRLYRQKPNKRILGFYRFHLNVYQFANRGNDNNIKKWLRNTIGEPPVIFEPVLAENTNKQFELYMLGKGYFNATVHNEVKKTGRKATVNYQIIGNEPYSVRKISYNIQDQYLSGFVYQDTINSLIMLGERYDEDILKSERDRISKDLRNKGFFRFSRDFIFFRIDSTPGDHRVDIELVINNPPRTSLADPGKATWPAHKRFIIDNIFIYPEYSPFRTSLSFPDTTIYRVKRQESASDYVFIHYDRLQIRPRAILNNILFEQGQYFSSDYVDLTYNYLSGLRNFRFINLQFSEDTDSSQATPSDTLGYLNARIDLSRSPVHSVTLEAEGLNTSGNLGVAGNVIYHNRNIFGGAEIFNLKLKGALEVTGEAFRNDVIQNLPFNTLEIGAEAAINLPKLFFPVSIERISRTARPKSIILTGINYRHRPDYTRYIYNLSYGFDWSPDPRKRKYFYPLEISTIKVFNDSLLRAKIPENNPLILSRFKDHLIAGSKYSYFFSTQQLGRDIDFIYFRSNIEIAGNLLYLLAKNMNLPNDDNQSYRLFNIPFAQYVKGDADLSYNRVFDENNALVFRVMAGLGVPYGNLNVLPFVKSYYGGGANGIRAWKIYSLGPGGYQDTLDVRFDRYGDIKLEANIEYRFSIYRFWKAALFADAGNVWFLNKNPQFPGGEFKMGKFYQDIAIGAGAGIRLDFDFFILRLDAAFPLRNPALPPGERWVSNIPGLRNWNFNLGIGYPF